MKNSLFVKLYLGVVTSILLISFILNQMDLKLNTNDSLRHYQEKKLVYNESIDTIFVGDSSCGRGIDSEYFNTISSKKSLNLALTGSFGIESSINMILQAKKVYPNLQNIVIIQVLDIWEREFSYNGFFDTKVDYSLFDEYSEALEVNFYKKYIEYLFNPKEFYWLSKSLTKNVNKVDPINDSNKESDIKYSNGRLKEESFTKIRYPFKYNIKQIMFRKLDNICTKLDLNCMYMHGVTHSKLYRNSKKEIQLINDFIIQNAKNIKISTNIFHYPSSMMGDSTNHVDLKYKQLNTKAYYDEMMHQKFINSL